MIEPGRQIPYFSQWESRDLTPLVLSEGFETALRRDPLWRSSGAQTIEEYAQWAWNICGMACFKMILAARTGRVFPTLELARSCTGFGGYQVDTATGAIKGLIYRPFVEFARAIHGIQSEVVTGVSALDLPEIFRRAEFLIASVHSSIRWPERVPPRKGGHLVLVLAASTQAIVFHNPSGLDVSTQEYVELDPERFARFFAGRGIAILPA